MNTQKYNIIIDHQFHSCFKIVQGYGEMSSEINVIVRSAQIHHVSLYLSRAFLRLQFGFQLPSFFSGPRVKLLDRLIKKASKASRE